MATTKSDLAIEARSLRMAYDETEVLHGIDLSVERGEQVFAVLGPNGAGKTTTIEILEGFRRRTGGDVQGARDRPRTGRRAVARADRHRPAIEHARSGADGCGDPPALRRVLCEPGADRPSPRLVRTDRTGVHAEQAAVGRPGTSPRCGAGPGGQPRAPVPRRTDHGLRPRGAPRRLAHDRRAQGARDDHRPDDALPRRGRGAGRPHRGDRPRAHRRRWHTHRARRARPGGHVDLVPAP